MNQLFSIGSFCFDLTWPEGICPPDNFMKFAVESGESEFSYEIRLVDTLPEIKSNVIARRADLTVYENDNKESRSIGIKGREEDYGYYEEISETQAVIYLAMDQLKDLNIDPVFSSLLALEKRMLKKDSMVLHCAYIRYKGKAILFSAPSETGKSTQADLWEKYRGSQTINGDRGLLRKVDDCWCVDGWPVCGTSEICYKEMTPIHAIVMLRQAPENKVRRLSIFEAFTLLYSQITINSWNREAVNKNINLIEQLLSEVPVYELGCTISEEAVNCLAQVLDIE